MSDEQSIPEQLRANADVAVSTFREHFKIALTFDQAGVERADRFINLFRESLSAVDRAIFRRLLTAFVGEAIIRTFGGAWVNKEGEWCVQVNEAIWACPFTKVAKQFRNGPTESVVGYFTLIPALLSSPGLDVPDAATDHSYSDSRKGKLDIINIHEVAMPRD